MTQTNYKKNIEQFNQRIREKIILKEKYLAQIEKLESIYERNGIDQEIQEANK